MSPEEKVVIAKIEELLAHMRVQTEGQRDLLHLIGELHERVVILEDNLYGEEEEHSLH